MALEGVVRTLFANDRSAITPSIRGHGAEAEISEGEELGFPHLCYGWPTVDEYEEWAGLGAGFKVEELFSLFGGEFVFRYCTRCHDWIRLLMLVVAELVRLLFQHLWEKQHL